MQQTAPTFQFEPTRSGDTLRGAKFTWAELVREAGRAVTAEPDLRHYLDVLVLRHDTLATAMATLLSRKLAVPLLPIRELLNIINAAFERDPRIVAAIEIDLDAIRSRDPSVEGYLTSFLHFKGFHAISAHRIAHHLWSQGSIHSARFIQSRVSEALAIDIHPAVPIGRGIFVDHGTGLVVGETAVIGNDVSILQEVTLGGTGKERGDRHPKVHDGVLLAAGAKVLGNIQIGRGAKVGAGSVVLRDVPPCATVAGVPARIVGWCRDTIPALEMNQKLPNQGPPGTI